MSGVVEWLSKDPIGIAGGLNQYVAFGNNPVMFVDPLGEWIAPVVGGGVGLVWGGFTGGFGGGWRGAVSGAAGGAVAGVITGWSGNTVIAGSVGGASSSVINQILHGENPFKKKNLAKTAVGTGTGAIFGYIGGPLGGKTGDVLLGIGGGTASAAGEIVIDAFQKAHDVGVDIIKPYSEKINEMPYE